MMFFKPYRSRIHRRVTACGERCSNGFTLVELLVVMMLLLMLAAVGLPTVRKLIKDQKTSQTARNVVAYIEGARSRAIANGEPVGVIFERAGTGDFVSRSHSIRMRMLTGLPPYSGESEASVAALYHYDPAEPNERTGIINAALFDPNENPLLLLSAQNAGGAGSPVRIGARLELHGGGTVRINSIGFALATDPILPSFPTDPPNNRTTVKITFDPRQPVRPDTVARSFIHPSRLVLITAAEETRPVSFRIHRLPTASNVDTLELLRGMAVDLSYAGIGPDGTHFAASTIDSGSAAASGDVNFQPVTIMFAPDGSVAFCAWGLGNVDQRPAGNMFFLMGKSDQVPLSPSSAEWFLNTSQEQSNLMDLESIWITVNPNNGNVYASPVASVSNTSSLNAAVLQSRQYALEADTMSSN